MLAFSRGVPAIPRFISASLQQLLTSHTFFSFLPYNSTASFPQDPKQWGLKTFCQAQLSNAQDKCRNRGEAAWSQHKPLWSVLQCVRLNDETLWSLLATRMITEGDDGNPCRKFAKHLPEDTWLAILQNFTSRKLPWEILKQQALSSEVQIAKVGLDKIFLGVTPCGGEWG